MRLRVGEIEFLLALFQQIDADGYKPVNRLTHTDMLPSLRELRQRIEFEYEARAYEAGKRRG